MESIMSDTTILIVDDDPTIITTINKELTTCYRVRVANSGERALQMAATEPRPDLILLDVLMPGMNGYAVLSKLKENPDTLEIPVIFVTSMEAADDEEKGLDLGAVDYITKPINPAILMARVKTHLTLKQASDFLQDKNTYLEAEVGRRMQENETIQNVSIRTLAHLAETRDTDTGEHILRTQAYVGILAKHLQSHPRFRDTITDHYVQLVTRSAPLHDIGKVGIPDSILLKPGKLNADEWTVMKTHAVLGAQAIEHAEKDIDQKVEFLTLAKEIAHYHHEKWDGSGYPDGLVGDAIPVSARLMALADVFDALISARVYKSAMTFEQAQGIIIEGSGKHFDPDVGNAFVESFDEFVGIAQQYKNK